MKPLPVLLFLGLCQSLAADVLLRLDFGNDYCPVAPGYTPVSRVYRSPRYLWISRVADGDRPDNPDPLLRDFASGRDGEFWIGLEDGSYTLTLILADSAEPRGPFAISLQGREVKTGVTLVPGRVERLRFPVQVAGGKLSLRLTAAENASFVVNGLVLEGPPAARLHPLFPNAPPDSLPTTGEVLRAAAPDLKATLRAYCEWLLARRAPNGFLGDFEIGGGQRVNYWWYTSAYPVRVLLAASRILDQPQYLDAATRILDTLVEEQLPNGAWAQNFLGRPARGLSEAELQDIYQRRWMNMADVGSIATSLAYSCGFVSGQRRGRYLAAIRRYCDQWASRWQLPSGAFTNGMENGKPQTEPYGVATSNEAAAFAALYAVSGEAKYLGVAERAARFLLDTWQKDGRPLCRPHHTTNAARPYLQPVTQFGDMFYHHDGLQFVYRHTRDPRFREKMRRVYEWHVHGGHGLERAIGGHPWFPLQDAWDNSKTAGMPLAYLMLEGMRGDGKLRRRIQLFQRFLATPEFARRIGVMLDDPDLPWGGHSLQSWAACSVAATGFAGLSVVEMLQPGLIHLAPQAGSGKPAGL